MYFCKRCGYDTDIKGNLKNHFRRKRTCKTTLSCVPINVLIDALKNGITHNYTQSTHNYTQSTHNYTQSTHNLHTTTHNLHTTTHKPKEKLVNKFICEFCNKIFSRSDSLRRHKKNYCTKKIEQQNEMIQKMKLELEFAKKEKLTMLREMEMLLDKVGDTHIQNQQINIHINSYGNENLDYITKDDIDRLVKIPYAAIPKLLKNIHFHPKHPENHNIKITNKKSRLANVWKGNKWEVIDKKEVISNMVDKGYNILDVKYEDVPCKNEKFEEFQQIYDSDDKQIKRQLNKEVEILVMNNS